MNASNQSQAERVAEIAANLVEADRGAGASLGEFVFKRDDGGRYIGDFHHARLSSIFQPILSADGGRVLGHTARVRCDTAKGPGVSPWGVFSAIANDAALVRLDRLCRALHLLNYFGRAQSEWLLWLRVETRLLTSVKQEHGKIFGRVIEQYFDIPTSRVVIELPVEAVQPETLTVGLANYRANGYRTAISHHPRLAADVFKIADFVRIGAIQNRSILAQSIGRAHAGGAAVVVKKVESEMLRAAAVGAGADGLQGFLIGAPAFELTDRAGGVHLERTWNVPTAA